MERNDASITANTPDSPRKIAGNVLTRMANEILQTARALMVLPLISRLFGAEAYGIWSQIGVTMALLAPILTLRLESALVRYTAGLGSTIEKTKAIFSSLLITLLVGIGALSIGVVVKQSLAIAMFADPSLSSYVVLSLGILFSRAVSSIALAYHRAHSRIIFYTLVQVGLAVLEFLALLISAWVFRSSFEVALFAILAIDIAVMLFLIGDVLRREHRIAFSPSLLAKFLRYSLPLVPAVALAWVVGASDRFVIVHYLGLAQAGTYSAAYRVAQILRLLIHPILFVLFPLAVMLWDRGERARTGRYLSDALRWFLILAIPAAAGIIAVGALTIQLISSGVFVTSNLLMILLTASELLAGVSMIYNLSLALEEKTWIQPLLFLVIGGLNLVLNLLWIPRLGILGGSLSTCLCRAVQLVIVMSIAQRTVHASIPWAAIAKATIASVGVYFAAAFLPVTGLLGLVLRVLAGTIVYAFLAVALGVVHKRDIARLGH